MKCGTCDTKFSEEEAVKIRGTNRYSNESKIIAHECPKCGESLSKEYTREKNSEICGCNALVDGADKETCSECGRIYHLHGRKGGFKEAWAIPASEEMAIGDAQEYWYSD